MKIAVVGGGISGLSAAVILSQNHEVHLFESDSRLGGHAHTVNVREPNGEIPVDTGFLVFNTLTYPHFTRFLDYLKVRSVDSDMTLSIMAPGGLEWAGTNLRSVFAQKRNMFRWPFLMMLRDIVRFHKEAEENLALSRHHGWSLRQLVEHRGMSSWFLAWYLLPMTGAIWSMSYANALEFPAETFLVFCMNHRLLQVNDRPVWRTIENGSIQYVQRAAKEITHTHCDSKVTSVRKISKGLVLNINGAEAAFDKIIFATHAPVTTKILSENFKMLAESLRPLRTTSNKVYLHRDHKVMPKNKICWSSWNVNAQKEIDNREDIVLSYYLNKLQPLKTRRDHFITLNSMPEQAHIEREFSYDHPQFDARAIELQSKLAHLQGTEGIYLAGAWTRYGFHEDGILSAVNVAKLFGETPPWM